MAFDCPIVKLEKYCLKIGSGATPRGGSNVYLEKGDVFLIRSQNIYNEGFNPSGLVYISESAAKNLSNVIVQENDVLINITGDSVARVCLAIGQYLPARVNQHVLIVRPKKDSFDPRYLRYYLITPSMQDYLLTIAGSGGTRNALTKSMIESLDIPKPDLNVQREISDILESFEKKIDINHQINLTLEEIAQTIFKSWFVDFDPVRAKISAKENGEDPEKAAMCALSGKSLNELENLTEEQFRQLKETASLFPNEMEDSEFGDIPKGWQTRTYGNIYKERKEKVLEKEAQVISAVSSGELTLQNTVFKKQVHSKSITNYKIVYPGDLAFNPSRINIGSAGFNLYEFNGAVSPVYTVMTLKENSLLAFARLHIKLASTKNRISTLCSGSVRQSLGTNEFNLIPVVIPDESIIDPFNKFFNCAEDLIKSFQEQNYTLKNILDTLLPKLINGEIE